MEESLAQPLTRRTAWTAIGSYVVGFGLSLALTIEAYLLVSQHVVTGASLTYWLLGLAMVQLVVQLIFFLHVGQEQKSHWNLVFLLSTAGIISIVVVGTLWIMNHLSYRMMPQQMDQTIMQEDQIFK